jgi:glycerol uptake facilitator-like aquaporin
VAPSLWAQLLGALIGVFWLRFVIFSNTAGSLGTLAVGVGFTLGGALVAELLGAFFLVNTVLTSANNDQAGKLAPLAIGLTVGVGILAFGPVSGASFNPCPR